MAGSKNRTTVVAEVSLILAAVFWGLNFAATKYAVEVIPPLVFMALRFAGGGLLLFLILLAFEPASRLGRRDLLPMAALGCFGMGAAQTGFTYGVSMTSAASTGLIFATAPVWGMILGAVLGLERPTRRGILGLTLCVAGWEWSSSRAWGQKARASPATTSSTSGGPGSMVMTTSLDSATSLGESATLAPCWASCSALVLVRLWTTSSWPASKRLPAMYAPMIPSPTNPTSSTY
jgi:drug/metabolite transporter (DMT)-like permease